MVGTKARAPITYISVERHKAIIEQGRLSGSRKGLQGHRVQVDGSYSIFDGFALFHRLGPDQGRRPENRKAGTRPQASIASYSSTGVILRNNNNVIVNNLFILEEQFPGCDPDAGVRHELDLQQHLLGRSGGAPRLQLDEGMTLGKQKTGSNASNSWPSTGRTA